MNLRTKADKTEAESVSNSNLLAWPTPGADDLHTMQGARGSRQRAIMGRPTWYERHVLGVSRRLLHTVVTNEIPKKSLQVGGKPLKCGCRCTDYNCMLCIKYGAAADVCTDSWDFRNFIGHHYALVHIYTFACRSTRAQRSTRWLMIPGSHTSNLIQLLPPRVFAL